MADRRIEPQRQRRNYTKKAQSEAYPENPATPAKEPIQVGGQLLDMHRFKPGNEGEVIKSIEHFMSDQGAWPGIESRALKKHIDTAKRTADDLLKQKERAYRESKEIGDDTKRFMEQHEFQAAKANRLADPWANFLYYDSETNVAAMEAALKLEQYGSRNIERLSKVNDDSDIAIDLSKTSTDILSKYAHIPKAWHEGVLEPVLAGQQSEIKQKIIKKRFEQTDAKKVQTAKGIVHGQIGNAVRLLKLSKGEYSLEAAEIMNKGVTDAQALLLSHFGDEKIANGHIIDSFKKLWIDSDKPGEEGYLQNDIGDILTGDQLKEALSTITVNGIPFLQLRDENNEPLALILEKQQAAAWGRQDKRNTIQSIQIGKKQKKWNNDNALVAASNQADALAENNGEPLNALQLRNLADEHIKGLDPNALKAIGLTPSAVAESIYKLYKPAEREFTIEEKNHYQGELTYHNSRGLYFDDLMVAELESAGSWGAELRLANIKGVIKYRSEARTSARTAIKNRLKTTVTNNILTHESLSETHLQKESGQKKVELSKLAAADASENVLIETQDTLEALLDTYSDQDLNDPTVQDSIYQSIAKSLEGREEYTDPNFYYFINVGKGTLGVEQNRIPAISRTQGNLNGTWSIDYEPLDNLATWSRYSRDVLFDNKGETDKILNKQFILPESGIQELTKALATGDLSDLSNDTREILRNFHLATNKPVGEIALQQVIKFAKGSNWVSKGLDKNLEATLKTNSQLLNGALITYNASPEKLTATDIALTVTDWNQNNRDLTATNKIVFRLARLDGQVGNNPMRSPMAGSIIDSGSNEKLGNYIVIQADRDGLGFRKGDRLMFSGGSSIIQKAGQVTKGSPLILTGGLGTVTGGLPPGNLQMTLFKSGTGFPQQIDQYPQSAQKAFLERNVYPLIRRKN